MPSKSNALLTSLINVIRNETQDQQNTNVRVANILQDLADSLINRNDDAMTVAEGQAGTVTDEKSVSPANLNAIIQALIAGGGSPVTANNVGFTPTNGLTSTDVQAMGVELKTLIDAISGNTSIFAPVQDLSALQNIDTTSATTYPDKGIIMVEDLGLYRLDRESTATPDNDLVIQPTTGVGRWLKVNSTASDPNLILSSAAFAGNTYTHTLNQKEVVSAASDLNNVSGLSEGQTGIIEVASGVALGIGPDTATFNVVNRAEAGAAQDTTLLNYLLITRVADNGSSQPQYYLQWMAPADISGGGSSSVQVFKEEFAGNNVLTQFQLAGWVDGQSQLVHISLNGTEQEANQYTISNTGQITFTTAPGAPVGGGTNNILVTFINVTAAANAVPSAPTGLAASNVQQTQFDVAWNAVSGADDYRLDVATDAGFTALVTGFNDLTVAGTSQTVTGLTAGTQYFVRVRAVNANGTSANSSTLTQTTSSSSPPGIPTNLNATSIQETQFTANWDAVATADDYRLDVALDAGFTSFVAGFNDLTVVGTSQAVTGLTAGTQYFWRVRASNANGASGNSATQNTTTTTSLAAPTNLQAQSITQGGFTLTWDAVTGATGYFLDIATDAGFTSFVAGYNNLAVTNPNSIVTGLTPNTPYFVRVRATDGVVTSANSTSINPSTLDNTGASSAPTNLTATPTEDSIVLMWTNPPEEYDSIVIQRKLSSDPPANFANTFANLLTTETEWIDTTVGASSYDYRVLTVNNGNNSPFSNEASAAELGGTDTVRPSVVTFEFGSLGSDKVRLTFDDDMDGGVVPVNGEFSFRLDNGSGFGAAFNPIVSDWEVPQSTPAATFRKAIVLTLAAADIAGITNTSTLELTITSSSLQDTSLNLLNDYGPANGSNNVGNLDIERLGFAIALDPANPAEVSGGLAQDISGNNNHLQSANAPAIDGNGMYDFDSASLHELNFTTQVQAVSNADFCFIGVIEWKAASDGLQQMWTGIQVANSEHFGKATTDNVFFRIASVVENTVSNAPWRAGISVFTVRRIGGVCTLQHNKNAPVTIAGGTTANRWYWLGRFGNNQHADIRIGWVSIHDSSGLTDTLVSDLQTFVAAKHGLTI